MKRPSRPALLALGWAVVMGLLGVAWVNSPAVGTFPALVVWTLPAAAAARGSRGGLAGLAPLPGRFWASLLAAAWLALLWTAWAELGPTWILDGLILREPRWTTLGRILKWLPFAFALLYSLGMLGLSLEARYRVAHPEKYARRGVAAAG